MLEEFYADIIANRLEKSASKVEKNPQRPLTSLPELLSVRGKRVVDYGLAGALLGGLLGGGTSAIYGSKPREALKHGLLGAAFGGLTGGSLPILWPRLPLFSVPGKLPGISKALWDEPDKALYFDPEKGSLLEAPGYLTELMVGKYGENEK